MKFINVLLLMCVSISFNIFGEDCSKNEHVKSVFKIATPFFGASGILQSKICNDSTFAKEKRDFFFDKILTPGMIEDYEEGKYPERCAFVITKGLYSFEENAKLKNFPPNACKEARTLLEKWAR